MSNPFTIPELTRYEALRNVARILMNYTEVVRVHNGRSRRPTYAADSVAIRDTARQLAERVLEAGEERRTCSRDQ